MTADEAMNPYDFSAPSFTARVPSMPYDFSQTWSYSDLDVSRFDGSLEASYQVRPRVTLRGRYRYVDYADDAPYLYDTSGRNHLFGASVGWAF